jgi:hypothetical protein
VNSQRVNPTRGLSAAYPAAAPVDGGPAKAWFIT